MATISTHNGTKAHQAHNRRDPRCVEKEDHIDPNGHHETWLDEPLEDAYQRMFGDAVEAYNAKQTRDDRKITDYLQSVKDSKKKNPVYEMIVGVYPEEGETLTEDQQREILREFYDTWSERNPHLELIGAYYHADEQGEPHLHLDYVPWADGYKRGMEKQTGLEKGLNQQGYWSSTGVKSKNPQTAQICWERFENQTLEKLCQDRGIAVSHPERDKKPEAKREHLETEVYQVQQDKEKAEQELDAIQADRLKAQLEHDVEVELRKHEIAGLDGEISDRQDTLEGLGDDISDRLGELDDLHDQIDDEQVTLASLTAQRQAEDSRLSMVKDKTKDAEKAFEAAQERHRQSVEAQKATFQKNKDILDKQRAEIERRKGILTKQDAADLQALRTWLRANGHSDILAQYDCERACLNAGIDPTTVKPWKLPDFEEKPKSKGRRTLDIDFDP